jgi:hypothetical protein
MRFDFPGHRCRETWSHSTKRFELSSSNTIFSMKECAGVLWSLIYITSDFKEKHISPPTEFSCFRRFIFKLWSDFFFKLSFGRTEESTWCLGCVNNRSPGMLWISHFKALCKATRTQIWSRCHSAWEQLIPRETTMYMEAHCRRQTSRCFRRQLAAFYDSRGIFTDPQKK